MEYIANSKLATDPLARANHTGTQTASTISDFDTQVRTNRLDQMTAPTGSVSLNSQKITNLATPTSNNDAVNKTYIDSKIGAVSGIASLGPDVTKAKAAAEKIFKIIETPSKINAVEMESNKCLL